MTHFSPSRRASAPRRHAAWLPLVLLAGFAGCGGGRSDLDATVLRAARLETAARSQLPELASLVEQIKNDKAGPADLSVAPGDDQTNAAAHLAAELTDAIRLRVLPRQDELLTFERGRPTQSQLDETRQMLREEAKLLAACEQGAAMPRCESGVRYDRGFFDRFPLLDDAALAARMHLMAAHVAIADDDRTRMLDQMGMASTWIAWLAAERRLEARLLAAQLRTQWFAAASAALQQPAPTHDYVTLFDQLREQLRQWPADRASLVGDRAVTLHAYESISLGLLERVVTIEEKKQLEKEGWLATIRGMDQHAIDRDELFYLRVMERLINLADEPYFRRVEELSELIARIDPATREGRSAPLATRLFLFGIGDAIELIARDRALAEGWLLALASAAGFDLPPYRINPLNGRPYEAVRDPAGVVMQLNDLNAPNPRVAVPIDLGEDR